MQTGHGTLRFTLAGTVNLVAVSSGPRSSGPGTLPAHVRLVDLATAGELAELAASLDALTPVASEDEFPPNDPGGLDGLIARAEARLVATRTGSGRAGS